MATGNRRPDGETGHTRGATAARTEPADVAEALAQQIVDLLAQKLSVKASQKAAKLAEKAARHAPSIERLAAQQAHFDALDLWTRDDRGTRRPRFTRDDIAEAAVRIADEEGFEAVSMRRLAAELGAGTMTLYHYVRTKDELLTLVNDAVMGELVVPDDEPLSTDWRAAMWTIARRSRDVLRRHPWLLDIADDPPIGPNSVRHFDQSMQALEPLAATLAEKLDIVTAIDEYTFGYCLHERNNLHDEAVAEPMKRYIAELVETGDYPHLAALTADRDIDDVFSEILAHAQDPERFDRNLARLLDGFNREFGVKRSPRTR